jgi:hypothetical protein
MLLQVLTELSCSPALSTIDISLTSVWLEAITRISILSVFRPAHLNCGATARQGRSGLLGKCFGWDSGRGPRFYEEGIGNAKETATA